MIRRFRYIIKSILCSKQILRNVFSRTAIIDNSSKHIVSLTSFGIRIRTVYYAIESIASGYVKPKKIILWLSEAEYKNLPKSLQRLQKRGLTILPCEDTKSYKKLVPLTTISEGLDDVEYVVTADDDIIYPKNWLQIFSYQGASDNKTISSQRARQIILDGSTVELYYKWPCLDDSSNVPPHLILPTGAGGIQYPIKFLNELQKYGDEFRKVAASQDDVWFWSVARASGYKQQFLYNPNMEQLQLAPGSQEVSLWNQNHRSHDEEGTTENDIALNNCLNYFNIQITQIRQKTST